MTRAEAIAFVDGLFNSYRRGYPIKTVCRWVLDDLGRYPEFTREWKVEINWEPTDERQFAPGWCGGPVFNVEHRPVIDMLAEVYDADTRVA
jgi:hypothetical protein